MATYNQNLITARDQIAANLVTITANPKPNYRIDGEMYSWQDLFDSYTNQLEKLNKLIDADAPQELNMYGYSPLD